MSDDSPRALVCLIEGESSLFRVELAGNKVIIALKDLIKEKGINSTKHAVLAKDLTLWKVDLASPSKDERKGLAGKYVQGSVKLDEDLDDISDYWPATASLNPKYLHIIVELPSGSRPAIPRRVLEPQLDSPISPRDETVSAIYKRLQKYRLVQVRGTPASGKSTLAELLGRYIIKLEKNTNVLLLYHWPEIATNIGPTAYLVKHLDWDPAEETVFIFDNAEMTYSDHGLWLGLFKSAHIHPRRRVIVFTSYGSPNKRIHLDSGTPYDFGPMQRVNLYSVLHDDGLPPVGLLLTWDEFNDLTCRQFSNLGHRFHPEFLREVFKLTVGHVGAVVDFMSVITAHNSYRAVKYNDDESCKYTWELFLRSVGPDELVDKLGNTSIFLRGLPEDSDLQRLAITHVFETVLRQNVVTSSDFTSKDDLTALQQCFRQGWVHADHLYSHEVGYVFASPLHRLYIEVKLLEKSPPASLEVINILDFMINVIRRFSRQILSAERTIGPGCVQRPPEAQFQDEFYRCCREYSKRGLLPFPEFGTAKGRADFYIPARGWGVELLRDGDRLERHVGRFSDTGIYHTTLPLSDYIILDFRKTRPKRAHPDLQNLYHIVFDDGFRRVSILDNARRPVCEDFMLLP